jgi:crotonobetainyl-CoA:carnitine CoA-transferase CaiB-like acyl-CoA transferase
MRHLGSQKPGLSALFHNFNRGKRSIALDLKADDDLSVARKLCDQADVIISNYRPSVMANIGLSYDQICQTNPTVIFTRITGFGTGGPQAALPAYDHVMQAQLGMTTIQGQAQGETPVHVQHAVCDKTTALMAAQAISSALFKRERTGKGSRIDLSMVDVGMHFFFPDAMMADTILTPEAAHLEPLTASYGVLAAQDGYCVIAGISDGAVKAVFDLIGKSELVHDPRFATLPARMMNLGDLIAEMTVDRIDKPLADVLAYMEAHDVPCCACLEPLEAFEHPQLTAMETVATVNHPYLGDVRSVRAAAKFDGQIGISHQPAPTLNQHGDAIRKEAQS